MHRPTTTMLVQTYPYNHRLEKAVPGNSDSKFSYSRAYRAALQQRAMPFLNVSAVLHRADVVADFREWPHPTWEQHTMLAKIVAWSITGLAGCAKATTSNAETARRTTTGGMCPAHSPEAVALSVQRRKVATATSCDRIDSSKAVLTAMQVLSYVKGKEAAGHKPDSALSGGAGGQWEIRASTVLNSDGVGERDSWSVFEDRPGKPGWITNGSAHAADAVDGATAAAAANTAVLTLMLSRMKNNRFPWLLYGMRRLLFTVGYMKTYGSTAGTFTVVYCGLEVGTVDTRWDDKVSLIATSVFELPLCPQPDASMGRFKGVREYGIVRLVAQGRVKVVSIGLCPLLAV